MYVCMYVCMCVCMYVYMYVCMYVRMYVYMCVYIYIYIYIYIRGVRLQPFACWACGFESHWGHGWLSLVSVVCCQVEVPASGRSPVQGSPTECDVSECDRGASTTRRLLPAGCCGAMNVYKGYLISVFHVTKN